MSLREVTIKFKKVKKDVAIYTVETDGINFTLYHSLKKMDYWSHSALSMDIMIVIKRTLQLMQQQHEETDDIKIEIKREQ